MCHFASYRPIASALAALALLAAGCSTRELYAVGQGWQRQECVKIADAAQRERCMASAARSYEEYQREVDAARSR